MEEIDDRVKKLLKGHQVVALDTMLFIYSMEARRSYIPFLRSIFYCIEKGLTKGVTSTITLTEVLIKPLKDQNIKAVKSYKFLLNNFPNLRMVNIDPQVAEKGAELRARYGIRIPDALQIASGIENQATIFLSNDCNLKKIKEIEIVLVKEMMDQFK
ncbi:MAG: PIN domain-containing protein [Deltaproteobacteria bacterium]|nr:PIN domain-containing protein [Deltaproteobacteria bacterium]MBW2341192.1 PIN domain-containing protein [Deltaproteobacteria bacterium]